VRPIPIVSALALIALVAVVLVRTQWIEPWLPLRASSVVREAIARVSADPRVTAALGRPVRAGWSTSGGLTRDETGWTEAFLWVPLSGPKDKGMLYVRAGRGSGPWTFSNLELRVGSQSVKLMDQEEPAHREPPGEPQFSPRVSRERPDGRYPCFLAPAGWDAHSIEAETTQCLPGLRNDRRYDEVEVNLRGGYLVLRHTDLFVDDEWPLGFTRCFRMWDTQSRAFGIGWNHPYDILPVGSRNPYTYVDLIMPDGDAIHYDRISEGTGYADAFYEHTATTTPFLHSTFNWNGAGWDLRFRDGALFLFPENYRGTKPHQGAPTAMQDARGRVIQVQRDGDRNLERLTSPSGHAIRLEHDGESRVTSATDDRGHTVRYTYDGWGNLATVTDGSEVVQYNYLDSNLISVAKHAGAEVGLRVRYIDGRVSAVTLADGRTYRFEFRTPANSNIPTEATVIAPDGTHTRVALPSR